MRVTYDPLKREKTLVERGLDFQDAPVIFAGRYVQIEDDRFDYGETRWQTVGWLNEAVVMVVWTPRGDAHHIISMRKCHEREAKKYIERMD